MAIMPEAVKCLNTSSNSKRFVFKSCSQRLKETQIDVFRSLEVVKAEPSGGTSFLLDALREWKELNTSEDFISFYEEILPSAQKLAQIILHREKIFLRLLHMVTVKARLSLEPTFGLLEALSRDILEEFLPFLGKLATAIVGLLTDGAYRDPDILRQVFTTWSRIMMHLQKYLVKDVVSILKITAQLRFFPDNYAREEMAKTVSFLMRSAPIDQLKQGLWKVLLEVAKSISPASRDGVTALLCHVVTGSSTRLHSKAEKVLRFLVDRSTLSAIHDKFPGGSGAVIEVIAGVIHSLCRQLDQQDLNLMYTCLSEEIKSCIENCFLEHLKHLIGFLTVALPDSRRSKTFDKVSLLEIIELLVSKYVLPAGTIEEEGLSSQVLRSILDLMLCLLDVPAISADLTCILPFYSCAFHLRKSSVIYFVKQLVTKGPQTSLAFGSWIMSAMDNFVETLPEQVLFILLDFFGRPRKQLMFAAVALNYLDKMKRVHKFFESKFCYWIELLDDTSEISDCSDNQVSQQEAAILWGAICCYPEVIDLSQHNSSQLRILIGKLDRLLETEAENIKGLPKSTWKSLLGAALSSFHELLLVTNNGNSELGLFLSLAKRHKKSLHVLSAVARFLDSAIGESSITGASSREIAEEFSAQNFVDSFCIFADNLSSQHKDVRYLTLKILSYYAKMEQRLTSNDERLKKKQKTENNGLGKDNTKCTNVVDILLAVEATPISIDSTRTIAILVSQIQTSLSSGTIHDDYICLLLHGIFGILHNRLSCLWPPALQCLAVLIIKHKVLVWNQFVQFLARYQSKAITLKDRMVKLKAESQPHSIFERFNLFSSVDFDCTPCETIAILLLQSLQNVPDVVESCSCELIQLFLNFMGYEDGSVTSVDLYVSHKCKGKQWKTILMEWLNLLRLMRNPRSLYQIKLLQEVVTKRALDDNDPNIQMRALDCLLNWNEFLIPYSQNLRNLIGWRTLREELTTWAVSRESRSIQEEHRSCIAPVIICLLAPKIRTLKLLGSRKHAGVSHRKAILRFLLQFDSNELELFFSLLLKIFLPSNLRLEIFGSQSDNLLRNVSDMLIVPKEISIDNILSNEATGFLHVVEDVFATFDMEHIGPFLDCLLMIVVQILEKCTHNLKMESSGKSPSAESHYAGDYSSVNKEGDDSSVNLERNALVKLKDLRALCIRIVSVALSRYEGHDFGECFWTIFFISVEPLIDIFKQKASSSGKPSSLLSCFVEISRSPILVPLLQTHDIVRTIFPTLTMRTASAAVISCVLEFIENLLMLDKDLEQQDYSIEKLLVPHLNDLLKSLCDLVSFNKELHRKSGGWIRQRVLRLLKFLLKYIKDSEPAELVVELVRPLLSKKGTSSDECLEALCVIKGIAPALSCESSRVLTALNPLLVIVGQELRLCICEILGVLASQDPSLASLAGLMKNLNAMSSSELGELDYDGRIAAYHIVQPQLFFGMKEEHAVAILSHCVYDMSSEQLIFRNSASTALQNFLLFAASVLSGESVDSADFNSGVNDFSYTWTSRSIQQILERTYLDSMREAMGKDISIRKEWVFLLGEMVSKFEHVPSLSSFRPLLDENFFSDIIHVQACNRSKALFVFRHKIRHANFSEDVTMKVFVPLFFSMMFDVKAGNGGQIIDMCVDALASVAAKVQWEAYRTLLMRCFCEMRFKPDKQKSALRLICATLDSFHFMNSDARNEDIDASLPPPSVKQRYLQKAVYPLVEKLLAADPERVNVSINLVALKLLKLLPVDYFESQIPSIIYRICNFLKNRLESIRDEARSALAACLKELGPEYLQFVVKKLRAILLKGHQVHILGYTLHYLLSNAITSTTNGVLDYCLEDLLDVVETDVLGYVAEEKEVEKIASKMKETKKRMSFETLKLISQSITFRTHALKLISPIYKHLRGHLSLEMKTKLEVMLDNIALGIECNTSSATSELLVFIYGLIEDSLVECRSNIRGTSSNSHLVTKFALCLLRNRLKSMELQKEDLQILSMLDPFVQLLGQCLTSKYESVISVACGCLAILIKHPLLSLKDHADPTKSFLLEIAQKAESSPLTISCLNLLAGLLSRFRLTLSAEELSTVFHSPIFVDMEIKPSPGALSLLKAIVKRELVAPAVYDKVCGIQKLMITTQDECIRKQCSRILLHFFLHYRLGEKRLQQHIDFFLANLCYEHPSGRLAVLEMLNSMLVRLPESMIHCQSGTFFIHLVVALANECDEKVSSVIPILIKKLLNRSSEQGKNSMLEYTLQLYQGQKQHLSCAAAQVLTLAGACGVGVCEHLHSILAVAKRKMGSSIITAGVIEPELSIEAEPQFCNEVYHSMLMLKELRKHCPDLYFKQDMEEIWIAVCKLLIHPHFLLRTASRDLLFLYFDKVEDASKKALKQASGSCEPCDIRSFFLFQPGSLFLIAVSLLKLLRTELSDHRETNDKMVKNLAKSIHELHILGKKATPSHQFWSRLCSSEKRFFLEGFELLGSREAKDAFYICTSRTPGAVNECSHDNDAEFPSLLVSPLLNMMGKLAMEIEDVQMKIIFNCFGRIASNLGAEESILYLDHLLLPLFKACEGFSGKVISDEVKQLAEEIQDSIRSLIGVAKFVEVRNNLLGGLRKKRARRKEAHKRVAAVDPMRHAKRKLRMAAKHREHKRRKIIAMKMGR